MVVPVDAVVVLEVELLELPLELLVEVLVVDELLLSVVELPEELSVDMLLLSVSVGYSCSDMSGSNWAWSVSSYRLRKYFCTHFPALRRTRSLKCSLASM